MEQFGNMNVDNVFGDLTKDMYNEFMPQAEESAKKWDIYHIHVEHGGYSLEIISDSWKPYVGDNLIISDKEHVGESIVSNSYGQQANS